MDFKFIRKGIALAILTGAVLIPSEQVEAAGRKEISKLPKMQISIALNIENLTKATAKVEEYLTLATRDYVDMAFAQTTEEESYVYVRSEASEESDWVGKIYNNGAGTVLETAGEWVKIESANVTGYVKAEYMLTEKEADAKAREILTAKNPEADILTLDDETIKNSFSYAESRAEEEERLAREALERGQAVVDFAVQFVGNPYRWGGTSLTNGADCSGFVQSVMRNFGVGMPRTSSAMRSSGVEVSYSEMIPGDVICYRGHVGIYAGNGRIVNAIDDAHGIGMSSATYADIVTIRRVL